MPLDRKIEDDLINVHRVHGDKNAIIFLKNSEHEYVEGLFYQAKHYGRSLFYFQGLRYDIMRNKDSSFSISMSEEQEINTEQYS